VIGFSRNNPPQKPSSKSAQDPLSTGQVQSTGFKGSSKYAASTEQQKHLEAVSTLLEAQGLGAADLLLAISVLAAIKQQLD
jgi:hypothetical protein